MEQVDESTRFIRSRLAKESKSLQIPTIAIILGSGLGGFAEKISGRAEIKSRDIPHYPVPQVAGHAGKLIFGQVKSGKNRRAVTILGFVGRSHFYESGDVNRAIYPIRVVHGLGIRKLVLTNAAGGVNPLFSPGDLMLINDHINLTFRRPTQRKRASLPRVSSWSENFSQPTYEPKFIRLARRAAEMSGVILKEGVYCGVIGPSYETAAEISMIRRLGADAVGMSTVLEALYARQVGIKTVGVSLITNLATGLSTTPASHEEVIEVGRQARDRFQSLVLALLSLMASRN